MRKSELEERLDRDFAELPKVSGYLIHCGEIEAKVHRRIDEVRKDLPKIYIDKDGLVSLRDPDYDHDIILGQMCREATKNIEEARKSIAKFEKWFGKKK